MASRLGRLWQSATASSYVSDLDYRDLPVRLVPLSDHCLIVVIDLQAIETYALKHSFHSSQFGDFWG
jgi:hypothetical protein